MEKLEILTVFLFFRLFTMEYCIASMDHIFLPPGDKQKYNGPLPNRGEVLIQLASGLEYIHSSGFSHGNIKPRSVLIANTNNKITMKWGN
jgi:serine/threonine protein kinase